MIINSQDEEIANSDDLNPEFVGLLLESIFNAEDLEGRYH